MITIDGSKGEGGGQVLRSSLALALVTGQPFRIVRIRAGRKKPGLLRQHLTAVQAAVEISKGAADGADMGSTELVFLPGKVRAGKYRFSVGTAGSTTLVLQTILPALMLGEEPSELTLEGGTHNPMAPPSDFLARTFLPLLEQCGPKVVVNLIRPGFYPAGGGQLEVRISPAKKLSPLYLDKRGEDRGRRVIAHFGALPEEIGRRAFRRVAGQFGWEPSVYEAMEYRNTLGPGFVLTVDVISEKVTEVFTGFGEKGVRAEQVAGDVIDPLRRYLASQAPVGEYLADQLLLPMAMAGAGSFVTDGLSPHATTNIEVIQQFLPVRFSIEESENGTRVWL